MAASDEDCTADPCTSNPSQACGGKQKLLLYNAQRPSDLSNNSGNAALPSSTNEVSSVRTMVVSSTTSYRSLYEITTILNTPSFTTPYSTLPCVDLSCFTLISSIPNPMSISRRSTRTSQRSTQSSTVSIGLPSHCTLICLDRIWISRAAEFHKVYVRKFVEKKSLNDLGGEAEMV